MPSPLRLLGIRLVLLLPLFLKAQSPAGFQAIPSEITATEERPFELQVQALDSRGERATGFTNRVSIRAYREREPQVVFSEYAPGLGAVEICNTGAARLDLAGWELNAIVDRSGEVIRTRIPSDTVLPPGGILVWTGNVELLSQPNALRSPVSLAYPSSRFGALALRGPDGRILDVLVMNHLLTPTWLTRWTGLETAFPTDSGSSLQRIGTVNRFQASDWSVAAQSIGQTNRGMPLPWASSRDPEPVQSFDLTFSQGAAVGDLVWSSGPGTFSLVLEHPPGLQRRIGHLSVSGLPALRIWAESGAGGSESRAGLPLPCRVALPPGFQGPAEIRLEVFPPGEFSVPETVRIPAGETEVQFDAVQLDDRIPDGRARVRLAAAAAGFAVAGADLYNDDDEIGHLFLELPDSVREDTGYQATMGKVMVAGAAAHDIQVALTTSPPLELPATVIIPAGSRTASFPIRVGDDGFYNRLPREVVTTAITSGWPAATAPTTVVDDEGPEFSLVLPDELVEGRPAVGRAILRFPRDRPDMLRITLRNPGVSSLAPILVDPGQTNIPFLLELPEDSEVGFPQSIVLTARLDSGFVVDRVIPVADNDIRNWVGKPEGLRFHRMPRLGLIGEEPNQGAGPFVGISDPLRWGSDGTAFQDAALNFPTADAQEQGSSIDFNHSDNRSSAGFTPKSPTSDLAIREVAGPAQSTLGAAIRLRIRMANLGISPIGTPRLILEPSEGLRIERIGGTPLDETCCSLGPIVHDLGPIGPGGEEAVEIEARASRPGMLQIRFRAESGWVDSSPQDNAAAHLLLVPGEDPGAAPVVEFQHAGGGIAWVESRTNLIATVPNALLLLDPDTFEPVRRIQVPDLGSEVVVFRDGRHAWVSLSGGDLAKVDLDAGSVEYRFRPFSPYAAPYRGLVPVEDAPDTLVVAGQSLGGGVEVHVYDHGVPRPNPAVGMGRAQGPVQALNLDEGRILALTDSHLRVFRVDPEGPVLERNWDPVWRPTQGAVSRLGNLLAFGTGSGLDLSSGTPVPRLNATVLDPISGLGFQPVPSRASSTSIGIQALRVPTFVPEWQVDIPRNGNVQPTLVPMGSRGVMVVDQTLRIIRPSAFGNRATALAIEASQSGRILGTNQALTIAVTVTNRSFWSFPGGQLVASWSRGIEPAPPLSGGGEATSIPLGPFHGGTNLSLRILTRAEGPQWLRLRLQSPLQDTGTGPKEAEVSFLVPSPPRLLPTDPVLVEGRFPNSPLVELVLDRPAPTNLEVAFQVEPLTANAADVTTLRPTARFAAGSRRALLALLVGDSLPENDETFRLRFLSGPVDPVADPILVTIVNDDFPSLLVYTPRLREGNAGSTGARVDLALTTSAPFLSEVAFRLVGVDAEPGIDFLPQEGWWVFEPGRTASDFEITILGDQRFERDELLGISLESPEGLILLGHTPMVTLLNDDPPPAPVARIHRSGSGGGFLVSFESVAGARYRLSYATQLEPSSWIPYEPVLDGDGSILTLNAEDSPDENRFFRLTAY